MWRPRFDLSRHIDHLQPALARLSRVPTGESVLQIHIMSSFEQPNDGLPAAFLVCRR